MVVECGGCVGGGSRGFGFLTKCLLEQLSWISPAVGWLYLLCILWMVVQYIIPPVTIVTGHKTHIFTYFSMKISKKHGWLFQRVTNDTWFGYFYVWEKFGNKRVKLCIRPVVLNISHVKDHYLFRIWATNHHLMIFSLSDPKRSIFCCRWVRFCPQFHVVLMWTACKLSNAVV